MDIEINCAFCARSFVRLCNMCKKNLCSAHDFHHECLNKIQGKAEEVKECKEIQCRFCKVKFFKLQDQESHNCAEICFMCQLDSIDKKPDYFCKKCQIFECSDHFRTHCQKLKHEFLTTEQYSNILPTITFQKEGVSLDDPLLCPREELITRIFQEMGLWKTVLLRSPPYSGKTSTMTLAIKEATKKNYRFCHLTMLGLGLTEVDQDFQNHWKENGRFSWTHEKFTFDELIKVIEKDEKNLYYIFLDEIQYIYWRFNKFWEIIKKIKSFTNSFWLYTVVFRKMKN